MARVFSALPARALHGRPPAMAGSMAGAVVAYLLVGSMLTPVSLLAIPDLVTDWQVRGGALYVLGGTTRSSTCTAKDPIEMCNITLSAPVGAGRVEHKASYAFLTTSERPRFRVVADPAHPQWLATDMALDLFWNRVACTTGGLLVLGAMSWGLGWLIWRNVRRWWGWRRAESVAVPLRLVSRQTVSGAQYWTVQGDDGKPERWTVPRRAAPFTLGSSSEVLGLRRLDGSAVMPLDSRLRWVGLTRAERALVLGPAAPSGRVGKR